MKLLKPIIACTVLMIGLTVGSCKKETYPSRDRSGIVPPPPIPPVVEPVDPTLVVFDNADAPDGWQTVGDPKIEKVSPKEGTGYLKNTITNGNDFMQFIKHLPANLDTKLTAGNGQFSFWWYISDVSLLKDDGQIEITSGGDADKEEYGWSVGKLLPTLANGWNLINLNFRDADLSGVPNPAAVNYFRIFFFTKNKDHADLVSGVDDLKFRAIPPPPPIVFDPVDIKDGWETVGEVKIEPLSPKEGTGYLKNTIPNGGDFMQFIKQLPAPLNVTFAPANGRFHFWLYISDVSYLKKDGSIEITSSGKSDDHEDAWDVTPLLDGLKNGWNEINLDLDKTNKTSDGGVDLSKVDHFRMFFFTNTKDHPDITVGIDDLKFISK
jgi:hypothetical protein